MSVNKHQPHVMVLPEDDANKDIANGFQLEMDQQYQRRIQILSVARGWIHVLEVFERDHVQDLQRYPNRYLVLVIDFDDVAGRRAAAETRIPAHLRDRVFIVGTRTEPEDLRRESRLSYEAIGQDLARDCRQGTTTVWDHPLLADNRTELARLSERVRAILFPPE